jgi:hypothetical protein
VEFIETVLGDERVPKLFEKAHNFLVHGMAPPEWSTVFSWSPLLSEEKKSALVFLDD